MLQLFIDREVREMLERRELCLLDLVFGTIAGFSDLAIGHTDKALTTKSAYDMLRTRKTRDADFMGQRVEPALIDYDEGGNTTVQGCDERDV